MTFNIVFFNFDSRMIKYKQLLRKQIDIIQMLLIKNEASIEFSKQSCIFKDNLINALN